jgi:glycosyltransferase involved in cell wall biosynthesis
MKSTADIVIINYNDKIHIDRAINSAINQTWNDTSVIVVDDGSDEETRSLYAKYGDKIKLIQLEREDKNKRTPSRARNSGIENADGDFICFLDSDNYYETGFIENLIKFDKDFQFCNWEIVGIENYKVNIEQVYKGHDFLRNYLQFQHLDHQAILMKRSYLNKVGYYDERLPRSQDCDLIARLALGGGEYYHTGYKGFVFEKHEQDQTKTVASVYGKTMWTLKNNISIAWLLGLLNDPYKILSYNQAIFDFCNAQEWKIDYNNSDFKTLRKSHLDMLGMELSESA